MNYSIWSDFSFYVYVAILIASAVVIVSSIRRLLSEEEEKNVSIDFPEIEENKTTDLDDMNQKQEFSENAALNTEEIVFKKEDTIFDTENKDTNIHSDEKAVLFLKNLNENLVEIKNSINKIYDFESRLTKLETLINNFENEIKLILEKQLKENLNNLDKNCQKFENYTEKQTPKYVRKYLEDIVDDFESLEKEVILKRLKAIIEDLKKVSGE